MVALDRFAANLVDAALQGKSVAGALEGFYDRLGNPRHQLNPLRFLRDHGDWELIRVGKQTAQTLGALLLDSVVKNLTHGFYSINLYEQVAADLVTKGIGFRHPVNGGDFTFTVSEPAIVHALLSMFNSNTIAMEILKHLIEQGVKASAGHWFEFLFAVAVVSRYQKSLLGTYKSVEEYLKNEVVPSVPSSAVLMPDNFMGPDIIYWNGEELLIVQIKLRKMHKAQITEAVDTTDIKRFYIRKGNKVIRGYETKAANVTQMISRHKIRRLLVCSHQVSNVADGVEVYNPGSDEAVSFPTERWFESLRVVYDNDKLEGFDENMIWKMLKDYEEEIPAANAHRK
jgi:hypothetical protein